MSNNGNGTAPHTNGAAASDGALAAGNGAPAADGHPAVRPQVNMAGIIVAGTRAKSRMTAAQNSTLVSIARSGRRSRSSDSAACSTARATS